MGKGGVTVDFDPKAFEKIMRLAKVDALCKEAAERVAQAAQATAPVKTGDYRRSITVEPRDATYRETWRVVGHDWKTILVEARTGNLARALRAARR